MMENQAKPKKIHGTYKIIAKRVGCSKEYVGRVLTDKVNDKGRVATLIITEARKVEEALS